MVETLFIIFTVLTAYLASSMYYSRNKKTKQEYFLSRHSEDLEVIYRQHFADKEIDYGEFCALWKKISLILEVPSDKLGVDDRFDVELRKGDSQGEFVNELEHFFLSECKKNLSIHQKLSA